MHFITCGRCFKILIQSPGGEKWKHTNLKFLHYMGKILSFEEVCDKLKIYTIHPKATTKGNKKLAH